MLAGGPIFPLLNGNIYSWKLFKFYQSIFKKNTRNTMLQTAVSVQI